MKKTNERSRILGVTKDFSQADSAPFLNVEVEITDGSKKVTRKLGFPFDASASEINKEVAKYEETYFKDKELAEASKEVEEASGQADKTINQLMK